MSRHDLPSEDIAERKKLAVLDEGGKPDDSVLVVRWRLRAPIEPPIPVRKVTRHHDSTHVMIADTMTMDGTPNTTTAHTGFGVIGYGPKLP